MGKALIGVGNNTSVSLGNGYAIPIAGGYLSSQTTEAYSQFPVRVPGTLSQLAVSVNSIGTTRAVAARINGADAIVLTIADGASGVLENAVNTASVSIGDLLNYRLTEAGTNPNFFWFRCLWEGANGAHSYIQTTNQTATGNFSTSAGSTQIKYVKPCGSYAPTGGAETIAKCTIRAAGTVKGFYLYAATNAIVGNTLFNLRKNGANGNQSFTVGGGVIGAFQDTSNTDTFASGDTLNFMGTVPDETSNHTLQVRCFGYSVEHSSAANDIFAGISATNGSAIARTASATENYLCIIGNNTSVGVTTETDATIQHGFNVIVSKLRALISANTYTGSSTLNSRKAGSAGNLTITIGAGVTGLVEDTSNSDTVAATDDYCVAISGGTANSMTLEWIGLLEAPDIYVMTAANFAGAAPVLGNGVLTQKQGLAAANLALTPVLASAAFQGKSLLPAPVSLSLTPVFASPDMNKAALQDLWLNDVVVQNGLAAFTDVTTMVILSDAPANWWQANTAYILGSKSITFGSPAFDATGGKVSTPQLNNGTVLGAGSAKVWAALDNTNSRIVAYGNLFAPVTTVIGKEWQLGALDIIMPRGP